MLLSLDNCPFLLLFSFQVADVFVGDHVVSINGRSLYGTRHYEVAKLLKELPQHCDFKMKLIEPHRAFGKLLKLSV